MSAVNEMALAVAPKSFDQLMDFAKMASKTELVPKNYRNKPEDVFIASQWGLNLGMHPIQAIQNIAVINGRPSIYGDAMIGVVRASGKLDSIKETFDNSTNTATCTVKRVGEEPVSGTFSFEDAKKAQLLNKQGPWTQYPKRMCKFRARSWVLRDVFADVIGGLHTVEEASDMRDVEVTVLEDTSPQLPDHKPSGEDIEPSASPDEKNKFYEFISDKGLKQYLSVEESTAIQGSISKSWLNELTKTLRDRKADVESTEAKEATPAPANTEVEDL